MVMMDTYYAPDKLQELWLKIDQLHLSYLEMEESSEKLDHRTRLEDCIKQFLFMAPHSKKFCYRETSEVLLRSASNKNDFSAYKAATAWNSIQLYAGNLLSQPWRKEYRQIKRYCGFFKHQIDASLASADIMFEVMGYKHCDKGILALDGPICPDLVTNVSKDCLIAYVECQILKAIWEEVSQSLNISWLEVLEFRQLHTGDVDNAVRTLTYKPQKQYSYHNGHRSQPAEPQYADPGRGAVAPPLPAYLYGCPNYATYAHVPTNAYPYSTPVNYGPAPIAKTTPYSNGYWSNGCIAPPQMYGYRVPTGQLIELDSRHNGTYDVVDNKKHEKAEQKPEPQKGNYDDWDYVYRNLESQGYSKDLGERGDILSAQSLKKFAPTNLDEAMQNLTTTARPLKISEALEKYDAEMENPKKVAERRNSQGSSYENLTEVKKPVKGTLKGRTLPSREKGASFADGTKTMNAIKSRKWECKACTYHNDNAKDICEMCGKSRVNVEQQMEIGGPQCSKCTLVNAKDAKVCTACSNDLKDSPTYI